MCAVCCTGYYGYLKITVKDVEQNNSKLKDTDSDDPNILKYLGMGTKERYIHRINSVSFRISIEKHSHSIVTMLVSIVLAVITGIILLNIPDSISDAIGSDFVVPVFQKKEMASRKSSWRVASSLLYSMSSVSSMVSDGRSYTCTRTRCHANHGLGINDYNPKHTTTSQEGGAVPEARPLSRVSGAVNLLIQFCS